MTLEFDGLLREGKFTAAIRYLSNELYKGGKMGHTRKTVLDEAANRIEEYEREYISKREILEHCDKSANTCSDLAAKALMSEGKGETRTSALGAAAYFFEQERIHRYDIPNIIELLSEHK